MEEKDLCFNGPFLLERPLRQRSSLFAVYSGEWRVFGIGYPNRVISSTDLKTWTCRISEKQQFKFANFCGVAYGARKFVLCDVYGNFSTSNDGSTWIQNTAEIGVKPVAFLYKAGHFT